MVKIKNYAKLVRKRRNRGERDWYQWIIFVDEDDSVLNTIEQVEYLLHPTFPSPRRRKRNREGKFALIMRGWGSFRTIVTINYVDGKQERVKHYLNLSKEWDEEDYAFFRQIYPNIE